MRNRQVKWVFIRTASVSWRALSNWCALRTLIATSCFCSTVFAATPHNIFPSKTVYFGVNIGGGSTEWKYLIDTTDPNDPSYTTPTAVTEGGPSWGVVFGYDLNKNFAIELQYMQFANAKIQLSPLSPYPTNNFTTKTDAYSLSGKFLAPLAKTKLRAFAAVGVGMVERTDPLVGFDPLKTFTGKNLTSSCITPYMSSGLVYNFDRHWMLESGFQYYTGFGKSQLNPVASFIPFAWDTYGRLAYQM